MSFLDPAHAQRYETGLATLAKPYRLYGSEVVSAIYPPPGISASAGLLSNANDLARYDAAIDSFALIRKETLERAWTPAISTDGRTAACTSLGWFITTANGLRLVWHYGYWPDSFSSLYKVPERNLTFIVLANSDALSAPFVSATAPCSSRRSRPRSSGSSFVSEAAAGSESTARSLMDRWLDQRRSSVRREIMVDPALYNSYAGEYDVEAGERLKVIVEGNTLYVQIFRFPRVPGRFQRRRKDSFSKRRTCR